MRHARRLSLGRITFAGELLLRIALIAITESNIGVHVPYIFLSGKAPNHGSMRAEILEILYSNRSRFISLRLIAYVYTSLLNHNHFTID